MPKHKNIKMGRVCANLCYFVSLHPGTVFTKILSIQYSFFLFLMMAPAFSSDRDTLYIASSTK